MKIEFKDVSKRFAYEWIFKKINYTIESGARTSIVGPNGAGKSTLVQILLGSVDPSKGEIIYSSGEDISVNDVFNRFSFTAPYMGIPDDFTMMEFLTFHFRFRKILAGIDLENIIDICYLDKHRKKHIRQFSSGMRQRFKLSVALFTDCDVVVLDEPTTNLDEEGKEWFYSLVHKYIQDRTLILATNEKSDLQLCTSSINILDYK